MNFAQNLARLRREKKLSLQGLADMSGVSKSMLSKIEREEKNPTLQVAAQIAEGLGLSLSAMLGEEQPRAVMQLRPADQLLFRDELTGFERRLLSPSFKSKGVDFVLNRMPAGQSSPLFPPHQPGVKEYAYLAQGQMQVRLDGEAFDLRAGDSIYFEAARKHQFVNTGEEECQYFLVVDAHG